MLSEQSRAIDIESKSQDQNSLPKLTDISQRGQIPEDERLVPVMIHPNLRLDVPKKFTVAITSKDKTIQYKLKIFPVKDVDGQSFDAGLFYRDLMTDAWLVLH